MTKPGDQLEDIKLLAVWQIAAAKELWQLVAISCTT
jgi:hypothetical protein